MKLDKHTLWMIIGCGLPLILIILAPAFKISSGASIFIFIVAMFACHLLTPVHGHGGHQRGQNHAEQHSNKAT